MHQMLSPAVFYEVTKNRLANQFTRIDAINSRLGTMLMLATAALTGFAGFEALLIGISSPGTDSIHFSTIVSSGVAGAAFIIILLLIVYTYIRLTGRVTPLPRLRALRDNSFLYPEDIMREWAGDQHMHACELNEALLDRATIIEAVVTFLVILELVSLAAALFLPIIL